MYKITKNHVHNKKNRVNMDKTTKTYYNKFNIYPERVLEVPHGGTSFFAEISGIF